MQLEGWLVFFSLFCAFDSYFFIFAISDEAAVVCFVYLLMNTFLLWQMFFLYQMFGKVTEHKLMYKINQLMK